MKKGFLLFAVLMVLGGFGTLFAVGSPEQVPFTPQLAEGANFDGNASAWLGTRKAPSIPARELDNVADTSSDSRVMPEPAERIADFRRAVFLRDDQTQQLIALANEHAEIRDEIIVSDSTRVEAEEILERRRQRSSDAEAILASFSREERAALRGHRISILDLAAAVAADP